MLNLLRTYTVYAGISLTFQSLLNKLKLFHCTKGIILMTSKISDQFRYFQPSQNYLTVIYKCTWNHTCRKKILYMNQSGFRKFHSCEIALCKIMNAWFIIMVVPRSQGRHYLCLLTVGMGVALQDDHGLAEPCAIWALDVRICRWDRGC